MAFGAHTVRAKSKPIGKMNRTEQAERRRDAVLFELVGIAGLSIDMQPERAGVLSKPRIQTAASNLVTRIDDALRNRRSAPISRNGEDLLTKSRDWIQRVATSEDTGSAMMAFRNNVRFDAQAVAEELMQGNEVAPPVQLPSKGHEQALKSAHTTLRRLP